MRRLFGCVLFLLLPLAASAQSWGIVAGQVTSTRDGESVPGASVLVRDTNFGTAANEDGFFRFRVPTGCYTLRVTAVGFADLESELCVRRDEEKLFNVRLSPTSRELGEIAVEADAAGEAGVFTLTPEEIQNIPGPFRTPFQAIRALPGVAANNELSNQFSVRGGGYNENLLFLNGYEVYLPFRPRQGEQEGLGLLNPDLVDALTLYTGGFPARYGGKLSSALDVRYRRPNQERLHGSATLSLLDAGAAAGASAFGGKLGWVMGVRRAQAQRLFGTQELKGRYDPAYTDVQGVLSYRFSDRVEVEATGVVVEHRFNLDPVNRRTYFGVISLDPSRPSDFQSVYTEFSGSQTDGYNTRFGGVRLKTRLTDRFRAEHDVSVFNTDEFEKREVTGSANLTQVDPGSGAETDLGNGTQQEFADNRVQVNTLTGQGRYVLSAGRQAYELGWLARALRYDDRIHEEAFNTTFQDDEEVRLVLDSLRDQLDLTTQQYAAYTQAALDLLPGSPDKLTATVGVRADYFAFTEELTFSPRLNVRWVASPATTVLGSAGLFYQAPNYLELRGNPAAQENIQVSLNDSLSSQRAMQIVAGVEHFLPARRLSLRAEAYYKHLTNLVSYGVENARVEYSGVNDSHGFIYGFDVQIKGEFVPGLESWVNYGFLVGRERFDAAYVTRYNGGLLPRPTDQRHTFSFYVQDYVPGDPTWRIHLRALFGSGYPFTPLSVTSRVGNRVVFGPGPRNASRYDEYRRLDLGVAKVITFGSDVKGTETKVELTGELLNVFDMVNEVASQYVIAGDRFRRAPIRLTPRTVNVRLRVTF